VDRNEAAARLDVRVRDIQHLVDHPAGTVAVLCEGDAMLISATVTRRYVPEVDDVPPEPAVPPSAPVGLSGQGPSRTSGKVRR